ncbi:MAG TPA: preprotein translocase subunit SecE [Candidatus Sulfotelmatobacter sp.]|nr:preprotein translocase subunit SecE [Candidatus Sulfotelmatobacter sp.]
MLERIKDSVTEAWDATARFLREVRGEIRKVTWPQKKEIIGSTVVVIVSVGIMAIFLGLVDLVLQNLLTYVIKK